MVQPSTCVWSCWRKWMGLPPYEASQTCPQLINRAQHVNENFSKTTENHIEIPAGPLTPTHKTKRTFMHTMIFFLYLTHMAKHRANFHCLAGLGWALSLRKEGNVYWGTDLNGVCKWCLSEPDLGTAGEQFNDLSVSAGESRGCSFPYKLFQGDGLKPGVSVTWLITAMRHIPGISASSCRLGMWACCLGDVPGH